MTNTETYIMISGIVGLYIGLLIGICLQTLQNKAIDRKMRGHYRDLIQYDKVKVITMLNDISENYKNLSILMPIGQLKHTRNRIHKLIYELNRLFTE